MSDAPVLATNAGVTVAEGATGSVIGSAALATTDADNTAAELIYTLTSVPANGTLLLSGLALGVGDSFTQADLDLGLVTYDHDGSETSSDGFGFDVTDGTDTIAGQSFAITVTPVNDAPVLATNAGVTVAEGATGSVIGSAALATTDADNTAAELIYTLTSVPANGTLLLSGLALGVGDSFTQADLDLGLVTYGHDGSETSSDGFGFDVTDGTDTIAGQSFAITVTPVSDPIIFERSVISGLDDVEERSTGSMYTNSSDLELVDDGSKIDQLIGIRFTGIDIPQGAIITAAYIQFQVDEVSTGAATLTIRGEDSDDAAAFTKNKLDVSSRTMTDASANWLPADWVARGEAGLDQRTSDLTAIIQEIIDREGWTALNDMVFTITGSGTRTAESFEGDADGAPMLHVEYVLPDTGNIAPVLDLNGASAGTDYTALFTENGPAVAIAGTAVLITDDDDVSMERATITLANPQANDRLTVNLAGLPATISVDPTSTDTTIILIGSASKSDYETALQQVQFENTSDLPGSTDRVINVVVNDGPAPSNTAVTTISIDRAPDAADDFATTQADTPIGIVDVLANDDEGDGPATIAAYDTVSAQGGSVINNGDGTFAYTPLAGFTGTDTFHYTIGDQDGDESTAEVSITVTDGAPIILERSVISGLDDVEERSTGSVSTNSSDLELVDDRNNTDRTIGIRFTGIDIPQGAIITAAYIQFQVDEVSTGAATLTIRGEDSDDAAAFTNNKLDVSSRTMTDASANWLPADWVARGEAGLDQRTSDLTAIIQEIIDREGWAALNDMVFTITGSGTRTAEAFEGDADGAPMLHVEYVLPDTGNIAPVLDLNGASAGTDYTALFTENGPAVAIAGTAVLITDDDDTELNRATITIDNPLPGDELIVNEAGLPPGVVVHSTSTTTEVVLIGTASPADYQVAIQQVHFQSASETPGASRAVQVVVYDSQAPSNTAITTITIDQAPDAVDDSSFTQIDTAVITGNVLVNDDHGDGPATITAFDAVSVQGGSVINNGDGTFVYTPLAGFTGTDTFHYTIGDQDGDESTAEVSITVTDSSGLLNPVVVAIHDLAAQGIPDPSGLAYDPATGKMFLSDAEIDESPTFDLADLFVFSLDGVKEQSITPGFTDEPTGLALDPTQDLLFISDDDEREIFVVDPANPTTALWSFGTSTIGAADPEDVAVDSANGHLFIMSGTDRTIVETDYTGTQVFSTIVLPSEISDPEALAFDPVENVFYVGGGFSYMIWKVDLGGNILEELDLLVDYRNPINNTRVHVKDIELAPASDGSGETHIYVADFGNSHVMDGRLFEIDPYDATAAPDFATSDADDLFII